MTRLFAALFFLLTSHAHAAEPFAVTGNYYIDFSGIPVGKLWVEVKFDGEECYAQSVLKTTGLVSMFEKIKSTTRANGVYKNGEWRPLDYANSKKDSDGVETTNLSFSPGGALLKRELSKEDDPNWRPRVPAAEAKDAWHPAMALCAWGNGLNNQAAGEVSEYRIYDGKRHFLVQAERLDDEQFRLSRQPLSGYTPKEQKRFDEGDPELILTQNYGELLPSAVSVPLGMGTINIVFEQED